MATEGFPKRLGDAMKRWHGEGDGQSALSRELEARQVRGASRTMIRNYLKGGHAPSLDFVEAAADVLGVRVEWLATGSKPMTEAEETAGRLSEEGENLVLRRFVKAAPAAWADALQHFPDAAVRLILDAVALALQWRDETPDGSALIQETDRLAEVFWAPARAFGRPSTPPTVREFHAYAVAMLHAIHLAIPSKPGGRLA